MGAQDEQAKLEALPRAISKRHVVVNLSEGGTFLVERWPLAKMLYVLSWLSQLIKEVPDLTGLGAPGLSAMDLGLKVVQLLGDKLPEFLYLSVRPEDKAILVDLPADDQLDVLVEIIRLNWSEKLTKKAKELFGLFKSNLPANGKST